MLTDAFINRVVLGRGLHWRRRIEELFRTKLTYTKEIDIRMRYNFAKDIANAYRCSTQSYLIVLNYVLGVRVFVQTHLCNWSS